MYRAEGDAVRRTAGPSDDPPRKLDAMDPMHPPTSPTRDRPIAVGGLILVAFALVLLALGGTFTAQDPTTFDLWMLAVGVVVLAGTLVLLARRSHEPAPLPGVAMASLPSLSPVRFGDPPAVEPEYPGPRPSVMADLEAPASAVSDTIAGQYYGLARNPPGAHPTARRSSYRPPEEVPIPPALPFTAAVRRSPLPLERFEASGAIAAPRDPALAGEVARLSDRVSELERTDHARPAWATPPAVGGPGTCAGCGRPMPPGPPALVCPSCGRPLCASCDALATEGARPHWCPSCRARAEGRADPGEPMPWIETGRER